MKKKQSFQQFLLVLFFCAMSNILLAQRPKKWEFNLPINPIMLSKMDSLRALLPKVKFTDTLPIQITLRGADAPLETSREPESEVHAAINPNDSSNIVVATMRSISGSLGGSVSYRIYYTKNFGRTWQVSSFAGESPNIIVSAGGGDPVLAFDKTGKVFMSWLTVGLTSSLTIETQLNWASSTDGGVTWTYQAVVDKANFLSGQAVDKEWLAIDLSNSAFQNTVYMPYTKINSADTTYTVFLKRKLANSNLFETTSIKVTPDSLVSANFASIDVDSRGYIHILVASTTLQSDNIALYYCLSKDGGLTFPTVKKITDIQIPFYSVGQERERVIGIDSARVYPCPHIKIDKSGGIYNNRIYVSWAANGKTIRETQGMDIYSSYSVNDGQTWSTPRIVNDDTDTKTHQSHPILNVSPKGILAITWYDRRGDNQNIKTHLFMALSKNGGVSFEKNMMVSTAASDFSVIGNGNEKFGIGEYMGLVSTSCSMIPFWADGRSNDGNIDIYTASISLCQNSTSLNEVNSLISDFNFTRLFPDPVQEQLNLDLNIENSNTNLDITIADVNGRVYLQTKIEGLLSGQNIIPLSVKSLASGVYLCSIQSNKGLQSKVFQKIQ